MRGWVNPRSNGRVDPTMDVWPDPAALDRCRSRGSDEGRLTLGMHLEALP
jgi:hypothetical protein